MIDPKKLREWEKVYDDKFFKEHPGFVRWWAQHPHGDPNHDFAVRPRVAFKCECYRKEFLEAKQTGIAQ